MTTICKKCGFQVRCIGSGRYVCPEHGNVTQEGVRYAGSPTADKYASGIFRRYLDPKTGPGDLTEDDLVDDAPVFRVSRQEDARIQTAMILAHKAVMEQRLGRPVSALDAAVDWSQEGYAVAYRKHYTIEENL